ncbi:hypothetical protein [Enterococcus sp. LJL90]
MLRVTEAYRRKKNYPLKKLIDFDFVSKFEDYWLATKKKEDLNLFFKPKIFNDLREIELNKFVYNYYASKQNIDSSRQSFSFFITFTVVVFWSSMLNFLMNYFLDNFFEVTGSVFIISVMFTFFSGGLLSMYFWFSLIYKSNQLFTAYNYVASLLIEQGILEE